MKIKATYIKSGIFQKIENVKTIEDKGDYVRVFLEDGKRKVFDKKEFKLDAEF